MMADDLPWGGVQRRDVVHQLVPVRVSAESVNDYHVAIYIQHQRLTLVHQWDMGVALLKSPSQSTGSLVANEAKCISWLRCPVLQVLDYWPTGHHSASG